MKKLILAFALCGPLALAGCAGALPAPIVSGMRSALDDICPDIALASPYRDAMNASEKAAYVALVEACPPNPAPTDPAVLIADLYADYNLIAPLFGASPKTRKKA